MKFRVGSLVTMDASAKLLVASVLPSKVAAGAPAFTSGFSLSYREISRSSQTPFLLIYHHFQLGCPSILTARGSRKCINNSGVHASTSKSGELSLKKKGGINIACDVVMS